MHQTRKKKFLVCQQRLQGAEFWAVVVHMGCTVSPGSSRESAITIWRCARDVQKHPPWPWCGRVALIVSLSVTVKQALKGNFSIHVSHVQACSVFMKRWFQHEMIVCVLLMRSIGLRRR